MIMKMTIHSTFRSSHERCSVRKGVFRGCSYGGGLTRLGGLARLGEISLDFAGILPKGDENFPYEHAQVVQPGKVGQSFL